MYELGFNEAYYGVAPTPQNEGWTAKEREGHTWTEKQRQDYDRGYAAGVRKQTEYPKRAWAYPPTP